MPGFSAEAPVASSGPDDVAGPGVAAPVAAPVPAPVPVAAPPVPAGPPVPVAFEQPNVTPVTNAPPGPTEPLAASKAAIGDLQAANADEQTAAKAEADAQAKKAEADAAQADKAAQEIRNRQAQADQQQAARDQARAKLVDLARQADDAVANHRFTDYMQTIPETKKLGLLLGGFISGVYGGGDPLAQINRLTDQHFAQQKAELGSKENAAKLRKEGVDDFDAHERDQRMLLELRERNYREAMAKEAEAQGLRSGNPLAYAKSQQLAAKIRAEGDSKVIEAATKYTTEQENLAHAKMFDARAGRYKQLAGGKGGGGSSDALGAFAEAAGALPAGAPISREVAALGVKAGFKLKDIGAQVRKYQAGGGGKAGAAGGGKPGTEVRDEDGNVIGNVTSGKGGAQGFATRDADYARAHDQLQALLDDVKAQGDRVLTPSNIKRRETLYHNAIIGVATVSPLGKTDEAMKAEAGSIGQSGGLSLTSANADAIQNKIKELAEQRARYRAQALTPVAKPAASAPAAAPKVPPEIIEKAKAAVKANGPNAASARRLLEQQQITVL